MERGRNEESRDRLKGNEGRNVEREGGRRKMDK